MGISKVGAVLIAALTLPFGCAKVVNIQPLVISQKVDIEPGSYTADGVKRSVPWDATYTIEKGTVTPHVSNFKVEPLIGVDVVGLTSSPWAGIRVAHVDNVGVDFGFDRENFTIGMDYLYHDIVVGPNLAYPYDLGVPHLGAKAAFLF